MTFFASVFFLTTPVANFTAIVNHTSGKFATGPNDTGGKLCHWYCCYH
jgi:hypothetical protein